MMQTILITGAGGFIGSHLTEKCVELGYKVKAFIRYNSRNNWGWLEGSKYRNAIEVILGDIREYDSVYNAMKDTDTVFHLAALIGIPYSYITPLAYIRTNIEGTYNVLQSARVLNVANVLITSTSEIYGTAKYVPIDEKHPAFCQSPYSATKISSDQLALSFYHSYELPTKIIRPFNTYGPRQSTRAIIPTIITQILYGHKKIMIGNIHPTRDLTFVEDTVNGFIEIAKSESLFGEVTNIGTNSEISIGDLANRIANLMEVDIELFSKKERIRPDKSEVERLCCDNSKLIKNTNWKPLYDLDSGLKKTIDWFIKYKEIYKPDIYNI